MKAEKYRGYFQIFLILVFAAFSVILSRFIGRPQERLDSIKGQETVFYVETQQTTLQSYELRFKTTGIVEAQSFVQITPQVSGRVTWVNPSIYTAGAFDSDEILFEIESADYELEIKRLEADVTRAKTALVKEEVEGAAAQAEWAQQSGEQPVPALVARAPQLQEAQANLSAAQANLASSKLRLERTKFQLPRGGRVKKSAIEVGQYLQAGTSYGEVFYKSSLQVASSLNDRELEWLYESSISEVEIHTSYLGQQKIYPGKLSRRATSIDVDTRFGTVYFDFEQEESGLVPGVFVEVIIRGPIFENTTLLPVSALQMNGQIWLVSDENRLVSHNPRIIHRTPDWIAVTNLRDSLSLVTSKLYGATEGALVEVPMNVSIK